MASNLFLSYDLDQPGQNYEAVHAAIKSLGQWYQFQYSVFYVHTELSPAAAFEIVRAAMDWNDKLLVINASGGVVTTWDKPPIEAINAIWPTSVTQPPARYASSNWSGDTGYRS